MITHAFFVLSYFLFTFSPQAIFKDPFRGGNNILVSNISFNTLQTSRKIHHVSFIKYPSASMTCILVKVICDSYTPSGEPIPTNKRHRAAQIFSDQKVIDEVPW